MPRLDSRHCFYRIFAVTLSGHLYFYARKFPPVVPFTLLTSCTLSHGPHSRGIASEYKNA